MPSSIATILVVVAAVLVVVGNVAAAWFKGQPTWVILGTFLVTSAGALLAGALMLPLVAS